MAASRVIGWLTALLLWYSPSAGQTATPLEAIPNPVNFDSTSSARFTLQVTDDQSEGVIDSLKFAFSEDEAITLGAGYSIYLVGGGIEEGRYVCTRDRCFYSGADIRGKEIATMDSVVVEIDSYCGICKRDAGYALTSSFTDTLFVYSGGTASLSVALLNVIVAASVEEAHSETAALSLNVFPNPSDGKVFIQLRGEHLGSEIEVRIYDILGREIRSQSTGFFGGQYAEIELSLENQPPGLYLARIIEKRQGGILRLAHRSIVKK